MSDCLLLHVQIQDCSQLVVDFQLLSYTGSRYHDHHEREISRLRERRQTINYNNNVFDDNGNVDEDTSANSDHHDADTSESKEQNGADTTAIYTTSQHDILEQFGTAKVPLCYPVSEFQQERLNALKDTPMSDEDWRRVRAEMAKDPAGYKGFPISAQRSTLKMRCSKHDNFGCKGCGH